MSDVTYLDITEKQIHEAITDELIFELKEASFDVILAIANGGCYIANLLSEKLNVPVINAYYSSKNGKGSGKHPNELPDLTGMNVLAADDICDSGETLNEIIDYYYGTDLTVDVSTLVVVDKYTSKHTPNYALITHIGDEWVNFVKDTV